MTALTHNATEGLLLPGLDGGNPLAFLAALGTLRTLTLACSDQKVTMGWVDLGGAWRPVVHMGCSVSDGEFISLLEGQLKKMIGHSALAFADNLNVTPEEFRSFARESLRGTSGANSDIDRIAADFAAAFACDLLATEQGPVQDTALRTMSGAGHQHFLKFMRQIVEQTTSEHLHKTLFAPWRYDDPVSNLTLRWDPADDSRYALQWRDPSGDPTRRSSGGMLGANRLAIEGLPLVTSAPVGTTLRTTGFVGSGARKTFWIWPIWAYPVSLDVCRSLLSHPMLVDGEASSSQSSLRDMGVAAVFRSQRITVGKFRNFTPATAIG